MSHKVLCLAGGGTHGLTQMVALAKKEKEVGDLTKYYDLMIGTSVGAMNASVLATGKITANDLLKIYPDWIKVIFKKNWNPFAFPKYDRKNFMDLFTRKFGTPKMNDCKTNLIITSVDLCEDRNHYFKSWEKEDGEEQLLDVMLRSFAAPIFFGAIVDEKTKKVWSDGGTGNNNIPVEDAFTQAILNGWFINCDTDCVEIDVYGTGFVNGAKSFDEVEKYRWLRQTLDFMDPLNGGLARAQSRVDQIERMKIIATALSPRVKFNYWDVEIDNKYNGIDNMDFDQLLKYGETMAQKPIIAI